MARGNEAKNKVIEKIKAAFGKDWIGEIDKKFYVWTTENGERIQIAISLTCPKVMVETETSTIEQDGDYDFSEPTVKAEKEFKPVEKTETEERNIQSLLAALGL